MPLQPDAHGHECTIEPRQNESWYLRRLPLEPHALNRSRPVKTRLETSEKTNTAVKSRYAKANHIEYTSLTTVALNRNSA